MRFCSTTPSIALKEFGAGRPIFLANATHATYGSRFTFTQEVFAERQRSYLDTFPLSQAVMASAAFPGIFNSVTLKRYPALVQPIRPGVPQRPPVPVGYDHLIDGGPADNLGIEALVTLAASHQTARAHALPQGATQAPCFFFVIDAYPEGVPQRTLWDADPRGIFGHTVDPNFSGAFDALLIQRRGTLLSLLGLGGQARAGGGSYVGDVLQRVSFDDLPQVLIGSGLQVVEVDIPRDFYTGGRSLLPIRRVEPCRLGECAPGVALGKSSPPTPEYFRCTAWHVNRAESHRVRSRPAPPARARRRRCQRAARLELSHPLSRDARLRAAADDAEEEIGNTCLIGRPCPAQVRYVDPPRPRRSRQQPIAHSQDRI